MSLRTLALLLPAMSLLACGDKAEDDDGDDGDDDPVQGLVCLARVDVSGDVEAEISFGEDEGCSGSGSGDAVSFSWGLNTDYTVFLWINGGVDVDAGPQSGLSGTVGLMDSDFTEWQSQSDACTVEITAMEADPDWEGSLWFSGTATCADALTTDEGSEIVISELAFRSVAPMAR